VTGTADLDGDRDLAVLARSGDAAINSLGRIAELPTPAGLSSFSRHNGLNRDFVD
jgi:hypothetical protein